MKKISVYIHIPFCAGKCSYCDFLSFPLTQANTKQYLQALSRELAIRGKELVAAGAVVDTVYIGGGTPSVLPDAQLELLLSDCRKHLPLAGTEWTVEINPGTIDRTKAEILAEYGVNRVSLGIQDTSEHRLAALGRTHTTDQAWQAFSLCRDFFPSVSVDIMTGLPGQSVAQSEASLRQICDWQPDHISLYGLKVEQGTPLSLQVQNGKAALPEEEEALTMMLQGRDVLLEHGFVHYEIANFAKPGHICRHNMTYWENRSYLGLGLGAHSYWYGSRLRNTEDLEHYQSSLQHDTLPVSEMVAVTRRMELEDTMMLGLRLMRGVSFAVFYRRFGEDLRAVFKEELLRLKENGLIECSEEAVFLSFKGLPLANLVFAEFVSSDTLT